ncbi:hypothetical protein MBANPS3_012473, partial [Mucor bainieri]
MQHITVRTEVHQAADQEKDQEDPEVLSEEVPPEVSQEALQEEDPGEDVKGEEGNSKDSTDQLNRLNDALEQKRQTSEALEQERRPNWQKKRMPNPLKPPTTTQNNNIDPGGENVRTENENNIRNGPDIICYCCGGLFFNKFIVSVKRYDIITKWHSAPDVEECAFWTVESGHIPKSQTDNRQPQL